MAVRVALIAWGKLSKLKIQGEQILIKSSEFGNMKYFEKNVGLMYFEHALFFS